MNKGLPILMLLLCATGCQSLGPNAAGGGAFGTLAGGLAGAAIGASEGKAPEGALIGAVTGAAAGTFAGDAIDRDNHRHAVAQQEFHNQQRANSITIDQVIRMTQSGLGSDVIVRQIASQGIVQRPTIDELIFLKQNQVDDPVIHALQNAPVAGQSPVAMPAISPQYIEAAPVFVESYPRPRRRRFGGPPRCVRRVEPGVEVFFGF